MLDDKLLLETDRFRVVEACKQEAGGQILRRSVIRHPGAVVILPLLEGSRVCLIRNYRISIDQTLIELPAGTLTPGEDPRDCALRELHEETGFTAGEMRLIHSFYVSPGIVDERMYLFAAEQLTPGDPEREPYERIENWIMPIGEAMELVRTRKIQDAKTIIGLSLYAQGMMDRTQEG